MATFLKLYFPLFLPGSAFGKPIRISGFALLAIAGMAHREACDDIFAITAIGTAAVFAAIASYLIRSVGRR